MGQPAEEVVLGERARAQAALVLEERLGPSWVIVLEALGADPAAGWAVVVDGLRLVRQTPVAGGNGRPSPEAVAVGRALHPPQMSS
jgi:hypothetical protein